MQDNAKHPSSSGDLDSKSNEITAQDRLVTLYFFFTAWRIVQYSNNIYALLLFYHVLVIVLSSTL